MSLLAGTRDCAQDRSIAKPAKPFFRGWSEASAPLRCQVNCPFEPAFSSIVTHRSESFLWLFRECVLAAGRTWLWMDSVLGWQLSSILISSLQTCFLQQLQVVTPWMPCLGQRVKSILVAKLFMEISNQERGNLPLGVHFCILCLWFCGGDGQSLFLAIALLISWFKT